MIACVDLLRLRDTWTGRAQRVAARLARQLSKRMSKGGKNKRSSNNATTMMGVNSNATF